MLRRITAAMLFALAVSGTFQEAAGADARAASPFELVPRTVPARHPRRAAFACAALGCGLVAASFPLADAADRRYEEYLVEGDPSRIESRWQASVRADRIASGALLSGEALLAGALWLAFLHRPHDAHVTLLVTPERCALACRF